MKLFLLGLLNATFYLVCTRSELDLAFTLFNKRFLSKLDIDAGTVFFLCVTLTTSRMKPYSKREDVTIFSEGFVRPLSKGTQPFSALYYNLMSRAVALPLQVFLLLRP